MLNSESQIKDKSLSSNKITLYKSHSTSWGGHPGNKDPPYCGAFVLTFVLTYVYVGSLVTAFSNDK